MTNKYSVVPTKLLEQIEEERVRLWSLFESTDLTELPPELSQITSVMWKLGNTRFPDYEGMLREVLGND